MINRILTSLFAAVFLVMTSGCEKRDVNLLEPASNPAFAEVYIDEFVAGLDYSAFSNSKFDAFEIDNKEYFKGTSSIRITVPGQNDPSGWFAGGVFYSKFPRDLSGYDALTFWAKASKTSVAEVGFGNDNAGNFKYAVMQQNMVFGTSWKKYIIPIPLASKLTAETGMLQYAAGADANGYGGQIWFDEIKYEKLGTIAYPRPVIADTVLNIEVGDVVEAGVNGVMFNVDGVDQTIGAAPAYFTLTSSDNNVVTITADGKVSAVSIGTAEITVNLGDVQAADKIKVNVAKAATKPTTAAPTPTQDAADVISLFSNAYTDVAVDTWNPGWLGSTTILEDIQVAGDDVKLYTKLNFVGIEFTTQMINATNMTHFHLDIWTPDSLSTAEFSAKLVDFGPNGLFGDGAGNPGGDDTELELKIGSNTSPALVSKNWIGIDIPLAQLPNRAHVAQLVLWGNDDFNTVYVDNAYFYNDGGSTPAEPSTAAPTPAQDRANVVSLFSNAYTDVTVDTWSADWPDDADVADVQVAGDDVKLYTNLVFAGIEFTSQTVDASSMTHFHMDIWTPDAVDAQTTFKIKLVDFGADGAYAGGDDAEHELTFDASTSPALITGSWISFDIPMTDFTNLTTTGHLAQMIISSELNTVYMDNVYFYNSSGGTPTEPSTAAPTPSQDGANVISLFSNAYTNVTVDTWSADWPDDADVADVQVAGDDVKLYTNLVYAGIEFTSQPVDASSMTHFHMDIWTPDAVDAQTTFKIKLVDFGADGAYAGGDDTEHELTFDASTSPALVTGSWISFDIPMTDFINLTTTGHLAQMIISSELNTVYMDNVYFYKSGGAAPTEPSTAATAPSFAEGDVISLFSNEYTNVTVDTWSADWPDDADVADVQIAGDDVKLYTNLVYAGIEFTSQPIDANAMTHFHLDIWTPDTTDAPAVFKIKLVDFGADGAYAGGDDTEHELTFDAATSPALVTGSWINFNIPLTDFTGLTTKGHLAQLIISGDPNTVYVDNVLLHK